MGLFDRFRTTASSATKSDKPDTSAQEATRLIDEGHVLEAEGKLDEAMQRYLGAIRLAPNPARGHLNRGNVLLLQGDLNGALNAFRTAIKHKPDYAGAYYNIGNALLNDDQLNEAAANYRRALEIQPDYAEVHCSLGVALKELGQMDSAIACFRKALEIDHALFEAHQNLGAAIEDIFNMGNVLMDNGQFEEAATKYKRALEINPDFAEVYINLGSALNVLGRSEEAMASHRRAIEIQPDNARARALKTVSLPVITHDIKASAAVPTEFDRALSELTDWLSSSPENRLNFSKEAELPFYLAYRNGNHAGLLSRYGDLVAASSAQVSSTSLPARKRIRLMVVSRHFHRHSVWDILLKGILTNLDRTRFEVVLYSMNRFEDEETKIARSLADIWRDPHAIKSFNACVDAMIADRPDVIFYPEIGMDSNTLRLAALRIAPLQVASWGHPITTGLPTMDLYFSGELFEAAEADTHYREQLVRLPGTGCYTTPIEIMPDPIHDLEDELNKRSAPYFVIPQMIFKFDPADDALFASIAAAVGECTFILFSKPKYTSVTNQVISRLNRAFHEHNLDPDQYLLVVPWIPREQFYRLLDLCDIYLDCPSFSGYTTAWQAVHRGLPVITQEGKYLRQRLAAGLLRKIGMTDTIAFSANDYVEIATRLAEECRDPALRNARHNVLKTAASLADRDISVVREFEQSVINALAERGRHFDFKKT